MDRAEIIFFLVRIHGNSIYATKIWTVLAIFAKWRQERRRVNFQAGFRGRGYRHWHPRPRRAEAGPQGCGRWQKL